MKQIDANDQNKENAMKHSVLTFSVLLVVVSGAFAQYDSWNVELVGRALSGSAKAIYAQGDYVYCSGGDKFIVFDVSTPETPVEVGHCYVQRVIADITVEDDYAYVVTTHDLYIIDISEPVLPVVLSRLELGESLYYVYYEDDLVFTCENDYYDIENTIIVDVSDPVSPTELVRWSEEFRGCMIDVESDTGYIYNGDTLMIVDLSELSSPVMVGAVNVVSYYPEQAWKTDDVVYVGGDSRGLSVVDVSDPTSPIEVSVMTGITIGAGQIIDTLFAVSMYNEIGLLDISEPLSPVPIDTIGLGSIEYGWYDLSFDGRNIYYLLAGWPYDSMFSWYGTLSGFMTFALDTADTLYSVSLSNYGNLRGNIAVSGGYVYVEEEVSGLTAIDLSDPESPIETPIDVGDQRSLKAHANYLFGYRRYYNSPFNIYDISDPATPVEVAELISGIKDICFYSHYMFAAGDRFRVKIFDLSPEPTLVDSFAEDVDVLEVDGHFLYCGSRQITIYDISDPLSPTLLGTSESDYIATHYLDVSNGYAFHDRLWDNLALTDISDPLRPVIVDTLLIEDVDDIAIQDTFLFAVNYSGLSVYNIADPLAPELVGFFRMGFYEGQIVIQGDKVYIWSETGGIVVLDISYFTSWHSSTPISPGWNMLSFPFEEGATLEELPPATIAPVYGVDAGTYEATDTFRTGEGYYVLSSSDTVATIEGRAPVYSVTMELVPGWNVIGGPYSTVSASILTDLPGIVPPIYTFDPITGGYTESDLLEPMKGYWVLARDSLEVEVP